MDRLAWDLGEPELPMTPQPATQNALLDSVLAPLPAFHPMKGPMLTQTLQDIIGKEPFYWRGQRKSLEDFSGAFVDLLADDETLTATEFGQFKQFLSSVRYPPNPFRNLDNTPSQSMPLPGHVDPADGSPLPPGNALQGAIDYSFGGLDGRQCASCHTLGTGLGPDAAFNFQTQTWNPLTAGVLGERHHAVVADDGTSAHPMKIPHLRNLYERVGCEFTTTSSKAGFGFLHDGACDSLTRFLATFVNLAGPNFPPAQRRQNLANQVAFMLQFSGTGNFDLTPFGPPEQYPPSTASNDTHALVGRQVTIMTSSITASQTTMLNLMEGQAQSNAVGLVVRYRSNNQTRGAMFLGNNQYRSDRSTEPLWSRSQLIALASAGNEVTWTVVPEGTETRLGVDRDSDGFSDMDEIVAGFNPSDASSHP
jgi:hypothetical protein